MCDPVAFLSFQALDQQHFRPMVLGCLVVPEVLLLLVAPLSAVFPALSSIGARVECASGRSWKSNISLRLHSPSGCSS